MSRSPFYNLTPSETPSSLSVGFLINFSISCFGPHPSSLPQKFSSYITFCNLTAWARLTTIVDMLYRLILICYNMWPSFKIFVPNQCFI